jgi:hypothetical protein
MGNKRTDQECLLAFYLNKFCQNSEFPLEIQRAGYNSVNAIIKSFYQHLGNLQPEIIKHRTLDSFLSSVRAIGFVKNDVSKKLTEPIDQFYPGYQRIIDPWYTSPSKKIWDHLVQFANLTNAKQSIGNGKKITASTDSESRTHASLSSSEVTEELSENALIDDLRVIEKSDIDPTTKDALVSARIGQGRFRTNVLQLWGNCCAVTKSATKAAIRASHLKPWRISNDRERLDPLNGLPLVASFDALFDAGLISFEDSGKLIVSSLLSEEERRIFGIIHKSRLSKKPPQKTAEYLAFHRENCFQA